jgi:ATP-dependent Clp protease, protease subunit
LAIKEPTVIEKTGHGEKMRGLLDRLLDDRIIIVSGVVSEIIASLTIAELLYLQKDNKTQDINMYINTPGGDVTAGLAIYDTMQFIECDVATFCIGQAASMGAVLLAAGTKGKRHALPHSEIMIHQPWGGVQGTAADITIQAEQILRKKRELINLLAKHTGMSPEKIEGDADRDFYMSALEAKDYGIVDEVVESLKEED